MSLVFASILTLFMSSPSMIACIHFMAVCGARASLALCILASLICHIGVPSISSITPGPNGVSLLFSVCTIGFAQTYSGALLSHSSIVICPFPSLLLQYSVASFVIMWFPLSLHAGHWKGMLWFFPIPAHCFWCTTLRQ